jgi:hypothetical protein
MQISLKFFKLAKKLSIFYFFCCFLCSITFFFLSLHKEVNIEYTRINKKLHIYEKKDFDS